MYKRYRSLNIQTAVWLFQLIKKYFKNLKFVVESVRLCWVLIARFHVQNQIYI